MYYIFYIYMRVFLLYVKIYCRLLKPRVWNFTTSDWLRSEASITWDCPFRVLTTETVGVHISAPCPARP